MVFVVESDGFFFGSCWVEIMWCGIVVYLICEVNIILFREECKMNLEGGILLSFLVFMIF